MCGCVWCVLEGFGSGMLQCFSKGRRAYFLMECWPCICGTTFCPGQFLGAGEGASWGPKEGCLDDNSISKGWEKQIVSSHWDAVPPQAWRIKVAPWVGESTGYQCTANAGCSALGRWHVAAVTVRYLTAARVGARWEAALGFGGSTGWIHVWAGWEALLCLALGSTRLSAKPSCSPLR